MIRSNNDGHVDGPGHLSSSQHNTGHEASVLSHGISGPMIERTFGEMIARRQGGYGPGGLPNADLFPTWDYALRWCRWKLSKATSEGQTRGRLHRRSGVFEVSQLQAGEKRHVVNGERRIGAKSRCLTNECVSGG